ncbi:tRNA uracil 4-sulfurtransferase ThiI [Longicatena caecimuris]|uniref:Probable tRNA sulfurtransferase n=1 Tax=Longicatena caecimuris TaxID=1796635 RepID=A0A4R3TLL6_9FIRM|nr:tRNA uracil 4-sulfurtransferase ThiI [Longicatena caecimuris]MCR1868848.1 tRNA 4-thiouridine(8) synthase ThiI [Longicatena caecimuris]MCU0103716.1 tRNA 4-thiouridine(8) synthase ThiI [Longicatena caecimuris]TCU63379.1 thiamine biosynthesis protein ThiI [Longicatena caecimuris]
MTIEQNKLTYDHILVRFGELSTKGKNRKDFIKRLLTNVKNALRDFNELTYERTHDRMYIMLNGEDHEAVAKHLQQVFGISSFSFAVKVASDIEVIKQTCLVLAKQSDAQTFKIEARRSFKQFPMVSDEINREVAGEILRNTDIKVNVREPQLRIQIELHQEATYIMTGKIKGNGGYPVGVGGKALVMLSGGIDSPVACYMTMKRGVAIECIHYTSPPYTSQAAQDKVLELARAIAPYQGHIRLHIIPFTDLQLAIYKNCDESYAITIMRRMMYRIAERVAQKQNCLAIVNGESIGQVASQTLESMQTINCVTDMPVIRPVACLDKLEIIDISQKIGTYDISIQPFEDCCTIFTPKNPVTKPTKHRAERLEGRFDFTSLIEDCIARMESVDIYPGRDMIEENENIF